MTINTATDLTFITNENEKSLLARFGSLIKDTRFFDVLVGYFYSSGFYSLYKELEPTEKIRILIGIGTDRKVFDLIQESGTNEQLTFSFSNKETKDKFSNTIQNEMDKLEESNTIEEGIHKFIKWLKSGKLEIRAYPSANIHAKLYIMTFKEDDRDVGRIITGSSNFSQSGLVDNLEFNVELKNVSDYTYAKDKFEELWENSINVSQSYVETIKTKTWLNDEITPYELYLKFLYEYFKEKINLDQEEIFRRYLPEEYMDLEYQTEAIKDAKVKLEEYGGVFISDVVGLGKTYISALLAQQLDGRNLVLAPPMLLEKENPGSWPNVFSDFKVHANFESIGKLDKLARKNTDKYKNVFIDEAHRFRTETNVTYENLAKICRGKRVILVTATPLNNYPKDILSQIKLFQKSRKSTIPNLPDLESFFSMLQKKLDGLDRKKDYQLYMQIVKDNAKQIREKVLKYLMVRRTRSEIEKYFTDDLKKQKLRFPEVEDPEKVYYQLNQTEDNVFNRTIELIIKDFQYTRYTPFLYMKSAIPHTVQLSQKNLRKFMMILLVKRLESSFYAFRKTLGRFIKSYEMFIDQYDNGDVYVSKKHFYKIFEYLEIGDYNAIQKLIDEDKAERYDAEDFTQSFKTNLENDLNILKKIDSLWKQVKRDPKIIAFKDILKTNEILKENKLIIFSESKETAEYLKSELSPIYKNKVLLFTGGFKTSALKESVIENFDAKAKNKKNKYKILVTTEVLSEGVNLHQSNVVINYDIPWNPTRMMQRVGRINRIDTKFDKIYSFNFFPTQQSNDQIKLKEAAQAKIQYFIEMLGNDARLLTDGEEIKSFDLFKRLNSKETITGEDQEDDSELKYLQIIRNIRDNEPDTFTKIKRLPKKARSARKSRDHFNSLLTYFRKGKLQKFFHSHNDKSNEVDFFEAAKIFEVKKDVKRDQLGNDFYKLLQDNKDEFENSTKPEAVIVTRKRGRDNASKILAILKTNEIKQCKKFTDEDEFYIKKVIKLIEEGGLPKQTAKTVFAAINKEFSDGFNPLKVLAILKSKISNKFFKETAAESAAQIFGPREVILSEYLRGNEKNG